VFGLALALHANVDAVLMAKLASPAAVGWYAAASKLQGALVYPAGVLIAAIYPTLCRLHVEDQSEFRRTAAAALRTTAILVAPLALCCAFYPDVGIRLFSRETFGPAEDNLRVLAVYVLLVYFSMPISSCLMAGGRQRPWAAVQFACVVVSLGLGWLLIPRFQASHGNGGLGVCVSSVASELIKVMAGVALLPRGVFTAELWRRLGRAALAAGAFVAIAWATHRLGSFLSAPLALGGYGLCLWAVGGIDRQELEALRALRRAPAR
jgi:O-antigen/teichoic acid export membrane protein